MLDDGGVYLPPSQFEAAFLSYAHESTDIAKTVAAARQTFRRFSELANR
jgi:glutamate-1-semialdehyde 2,1-aminomutase